MRKDASRTVELLATLGKMNASETQEGLYFFCRTGRDGPLAELSAFQPQC